MNEQITIPDELKIKLKREASARNMTLPEFVREILEQVVAEKRSNDPLFADQAVYDDDAGTDVAEKHDLNDL